MRFLVCLIAFLAAAALPATAQDIKAGARVTVTSDWHAKNGGPYSPKIVSCNSKSGLCLRDTRTSPANKPMIRTKHGLQVGFPQFGVTYLFQPAGKGLFFDSNGKPAGHFTWSQ